jgi:outer membrane protein assembly factor BamE (lipoprotein component of BamABCDE complex)
MMMTGGAFEGRGFSVRLRVFLAMAVGLALTGCALQRAQLANQAQNQMVGLTKEQVLACMGPPVNHAAVGETEVWTYTSGNGRTDTAINGNNFGATAISTQRSCTVNVVMTGGRVSSLNYNGPTGGLITPGEQCAFAVQNCTH